MRVLLAAEHESLLEELSCVLGAEGVEVSGVTTDGFECVRKARELRPDVILLDTGMPSCAVLAATRLVKTEMPEIKVVILTASPEIQDLFDAVRSGATGFMLKSMQGEQLMDALDDAMHDAPPHPQELAARLLEEFGQGTAWTPIRQGAAAPPGPATEAWTARPQHAEFEPLSDRQEEVLTLLTMGLSYKEIADQVCLTPRTVKYHMGEIMRKLHLRNRSQVIAYGGSHGIVASNPGEAVTGVPGTGATGVETVHWDIEDRKTEVDTRR